MVPGERVFLWAAGASPSRMLQCSMAAGSPSDSTWEAVCTLLRVGSLETGPRVRHGPPGVDRYVCPGWGLLWRLSGPPQAPPEANARRGNFLGLFSL